MANFHFALEVERFVSLTVVAFDFASDLTVDNRSKKGRSPDSSKPSKGYFEDRTNIEVAVSLAVESLWGLHDDGEMENYDH